MAYVHRKKKLAFLANPRTASTSVAKALMDIGFEQVGAHHSADGSEGLETFALVRNHWDAAVSWVFGKHLGEYKDLDFSDVSVFEFALDNEWVTETEMWAVHNADALLRYEYVKHLSFYLETYGFPPFELPELNVSEARCGLHYSHFYTDETREYIRDRFSAEIRRLGYEFSKKGETNETV